MPGRKPSGEWYSPYFAPSTIVVGVLVIIISISAGRYYGTLTIQQDERRYEPAAMMVVPNSSVAPTKVTRAVGARHGKPSPSAKTSH
jgi:hypothetical protein